MNPTALDEWSQDTAGLRRLAGALTRDAFAADDLVQETWLLGLRRGIAAPTRWFTGVLRFKAREARRAEDRRRRREGAAARPEGVASDPLEHVARLEACRRAVELLHQLPEPYRETLSLHFLAGRALAQIARDQGIPSATVRTRLSRGLEQLRERMDAHAGGRRRWSMLLMPFAAGSPRVGLATGAAVVVVAGLALGLAFVGTGSDSPRGLDVGIGDGSLAEPVARSGSADPDSPSLGGFVAGESRRPRGAAGDVAPAGRRPGSVASCCPRAWASGG